MGHALRSYQWQGRHSRIQKQRAPRLNVVRIFNSLRVFGNKMASGPRGLAIGACACWCPLQWRDQGIQPVAAVMWVGTPPVSSGRECPPGFQLFPSPRSWFCGVGEHRNPGDFRAGAAVVGTAMMAGCFGQGRFTQLIALCGRPERRRLPRVCRIKRRAKPSRHGLGFIATCKALPASSQRLLTRASAVKNRASSPAVFSFPAPARDVQGW